MKAHYRKVTSLLAEEEIEEAWSAIKQARALIPDDPHLYALQKEVKLKIEERNQRDMQARQDFSTSFHYTGKAQERQEEEAKQGDSPESAQSVLDELKARKMEEILEKRE